MIYQEAKKNVSKFINSRYENPDDELIIIDENVIETEFGWVFCYDSKKFKESGELIYALAGNAPIIFDNRDETLHVTGTSNDINYYIKEHQKKYNHDK